MVGPTIFKPTVLAMENLRLVFFAGVDLMEFIKFVRYFFFAHIIVRTCAQSGVQERKQHFCGPQDFIYLLFFLRSWQLRVSLTNMKIQLIL